MCKGVGGREALFLTIDLISRSHLYKRFLQFSVWAIIYFKVGEDYDTTVPVTRPLLQFPY